MRVLHLLDHSAPRRSDYSRRTLSLLEGLRAQGVQTVHLTGPGHGADAAAGAGTDSWHFYRTRTPVCLERLGLGPGLEPAVRAAALALRLRQVSRLTRPDLIHVHLPTTNALAALPAARLARMPLVVETDRRAGPPQPLPSGLLAWLERRALGVLRRRHPALRLLVAGGGEPEAALADRLGARPLRGHVVFTGSVSYRRAADLLPRADIVVFPAMAAARALAPSRHLLNAMAQGCAIVASDIDCHRELLAHGHSGILFQSGSRAALAEAIAGLLDQPGRQALLGAEAAAYVDSRRSWAATATRYRQLYERVLADCGRGRR
jgi:glycosyltransferase involved in cell wall biosynthesis